MVYVSAFSTSVGEEKSDGENGWKIFFSEKGSVKSDVSPICKKKE